MSTPSESWRSLGDEDHLDYLDWVDNEIDTRWELGRNRYQSYLHGFQGDPLDHAIEEALDLLFYLWVAKRRRQLEMNSNGRGDDDGR